jgi:hypothetical protein
VGGERETGACVSSYHTLDRRHPVGLSVLGEVLTAASAAAATTLGLMDGRVGGCGICGKGEHKIVGSGLSEIVGVATLS